MMIDRVSNESNWAIRGLVGLCLSYLAYLPVGMVASFGIPVRVPLQRAPRSQTGSWPSVCHPTTRRRHEATNRCLFMVRSTQSSTQSPDWDSTDPWRVLGIARGLPAPDAKEIKRIYKRLAMKYHPDVVTTKDSSSDEKKRASDRFAKINWAYSTIVEGKGTTATSARSSSSTSTSSGWEPPHRRTSSYRDPSQSTNRRSDADTASTDWRDYIPNTSRDETYDTGGDSFTQIFSDFIGAVGGTASATAGMGGANGASGIFKDFVDFLEQNVDAYSSGSTNTDADLRVLLQTGSVDEIGDEMDETELVVQQLSNKLANVQTELVDVTADLAVVAGTSYLERMQQQERKDELQAQKTVVEGYLKRARTRLVSLQTRYKELIVQGQNDSRAGGQSNRPTSSPSAPARTPSPSPAPESRASTASSDSWQDEGFGSFGRGRSSSSRRSRQRPSEPPAPSPFTAPATDRTATATTGSSTRVSDSARSTGASTSSESNVPPHRRSTSYYTDKMESERRLREIKVDEEFDKLKRDLGL